MEAKNAAPRPMVTKEVTKTVVMKIGRPGYKVIDLSNIDYLFCSLYFMLGY
jgi:hypothetical protein